MIKTILGDCLIEMTLLEKNSIDLILSDPPYFIDGMGSDWNAIKLKEKGQKANVVKGLPVGMKFDKEQGKKLQEFMSIFAYKAYNILKPGAFLILFSQGRLFHRMAVAVEDAGFEVRDMMVWEHEGGMAKAFTQDHFVNKRNISDRNKREIIKKLDGRKTPQLRPKFEPILIAQKPKEGTFVDNWLKWETGLINTKTKDNLFPTTVVYANKPKEHIGHMTVKPIPVLESIINVFTKSNQVVLDPFMGTATTGIACIKTGRQFIGIEREKEYFSLSEKRIKNARFF